ncbi:hypothetical protein Q4S57_28280 [Priestia megaterium]|uniref:hypothetical protein n=1 Tax=Priestia TaxID=2800373 RepID=UPI0005E139F7|nr:hypothetical protein [Priestia megaterium]MBK0010477.1 hypothetical protein [Bacillus sp. S35]MBY0199414.1 hypothetical protein [Priestia megaterium]MDO6851744.1 hypothetical protein [Priestia megaterium]CJF76132.1 Uncharacterised protein [Streptococcus pneumoniae]
MSELLLSKKFIPMYFIVAILIGVLYRYLGISWFQTAIVTVPCIIVGLASIARNFGDKN